jgi:phosphatidate phosphatase APP1
VGHIEFHVLRRSASWYEECHVPDLKDLLNKTSHTIEEAFDATTGSIKRQIKHFTGFDPIRIDPYRGYGNATDIFVKGRVLDDEGIKQPEPDPNVWENLKAMYKRFETDEISDVRVRARLYDMQQETTTDNEGYYTFHFQPQTPLNNEQPWHEVHLELLDDVVPNQGDVRATGEVLIPPASAEYVIVSDLDDTVVQSNAFSFWQNWKTLLLNNAHTRVPFAGVAAFYQALQAGSSGGAYNPIFYLSSSMWNIYDMFVDFMDIHHIPKGVLFLVDIGIDQERFITSGHRAHKISNIKILMDLYPDLSFILIGDSGQKDAEIYAEVARDCPGRIAAIYIRDVTKDRRRQEIQQIASDLHTRYGVDMLHVADTTEAAEHAAQHGFIDPAEVERVNQARSQAEG